VSSNALTDHGTCSTVLESKLKVQPTYLRDEIVCNTVLNLTPITVNLRMLARKFSSDWENDSAKEKKNLSCRTMLLSLEVIVIISRPALIVVNLCTKLEMNSFTHSKDRKVSQNLSLKTRLVRGQSGPRPRHQV